MKFLFGLNENDNTKSRTICEKVSNSKGDTNYYYDSEVIKVRLGVHSVHPMILNRRSERAMDGKPVDQQVMMSLFEAACWSPSNLNNQKWHFVYSARDDEYWNDYLKAIKILNRRWAKDAGLLVVALSKRSSANVRSQEEMPSNTFETGAAFMALALEGTARGLVVHPLGGYDKDKISKAIGLNEEDQYELEVMIVIGNRVHNNGVGRISKRNQIDKFISEGVFVEKL